MRVAARGESERSHVQQRNYVEAQRTSVTMSIAMDGNNGALQLMHMTRAKRSLCQLEQRGLE